MQSRGGAASIGDDDLALLPEELCRLAQAQATAATLLAGGNGADRYAEVFRAHTGVPEPYERSRPECSRRGLACPGPPGAWRA